MTDILPNITVAMPTLNSEKFLKESLQSITDQHYPSEKLEIIISDGGSSDRTIEIAKMYGAKIVDNLLKTGEAGKMAALKMASGKFIIFVDSDNVLPYKNWILDVIKPLLTHTRAVGSEPWEYTWRKTDGFITRYCALMGMNDPIVFYLGNYDRRNLISQSWTEVPHVEEDYKDYLLATFKSEPLPTIGANGSAFRTDLLKMYVKGDYLFDIDILTILLRKQGEVAFIKTKNSTIHYFCEADIFKFAKKQRRRVRDYLFHKYVINDRVYSWTNRAGVAKFILNCILIFPLISDACRGYIKKRDWAWFFHVMACEITLIVYGIEVILGFFGKKEEDRSGWQQ